MNWIEALSRKSRRGSYPRCLLKMHGSKEEVADRLNRLICWPDVLIQPDHHWMPAGLPVLNDQSWNLAPVQEAKLGQTALFLEPEEREMLKSWWRQVQAGNLPNWDIVSTCSYAGKKGLLLVEAKAHFNELKANGKTPAQKGNQNSLLNERQIAKAIAEADDWFNAHTHLSWNLRIDSHYQLNNRFAWGWKLASMGIPVVLVYLGFLNAHDVSDLGKPFVSDADWEHFLKAHARGFIPEAAWNAPLDIKGVPFLPLIRSVEIPLPSACSK